MRGPPDTEFLDAVLDKGIEMCMALNFTGGLAAFDFIISMAAPGSQELAGALLCKGIGLTARAVVTDSPMDLKAAEDYISAGNDILEAEV